VKLETERARELHAKFHSDRGGVNCEDCRVAGRALVHGRQRPARPRRTLERATDLLAADLSTARHRGQIVFTPGNRGYLLAAHPEGKGTYVCTSTGVAVYPDDARFRVWGP